MYMKKPKPGTKAWMKYIRSKRGKGKRKAHRPTVVVAIPRDAKLIVKRKPKNPYFMDVNETPQGTSTRRVWYSPDYENKGAM